MTDEPQARTDGATLVSEEKINQLIAAVDRLTAAVERNAIATWGASQAQAGMIGVGFSSDPNAAITVFK